MENPTIRNFRITAEDSSSVRRVPVLRYTRVVGYFSPSANWHKGKAEEISQRRLFDANKYLKGESSCSHGSHNFPQASSMDVSA